jgi:hypothetical protein
MPNDATSDEASIIIEQEGVNKYKIQSDQLEQIGTQLRGRREFSIFHSIILPLIVSVATIIFSSIFQYVSWFNSVGVKYTTDVADKAARSYETAAAAIGARYYAMFVFLPSLKYFIDEKTKIVSSAMALTTEIKDKETNVTKRKSAARSQLGPAVQSGGVPKDNEISLHKYHLDIKRKRFASYYEQLKLWNEKYENLLIDIEYALDRPVFEQADKGNENFRVSWDDFSQIDCLNSITEELQKLRLNPDSLKVRFAGINTCFIKINETLYGQLTTAISEPLPTFSKSTALQIEEQYSKLLAMADEFRCYAHQRIDYYNNQKDLVILSINYVWRWLTDATKTGALKHFEDTAVSCKPSARSEPGVASTKGYKG